MFFTQLVNVVHSYLEEGFWLFSKYSGWIWNKTLHHEGAYTVFTCCQHKTTYIIHFVQLFYRCTVILSGGVPGTTLGYFLKDGRMVQTPYKIHCWRRVKISSIFCICLQGTGQSMCMCVSAVWAWYIVTNHTRGQLKREIKNFPVLVRSWEFGLGNYVRSSRPESVRPFFKPRL